MGTAAALNWRPAPICEVPGLFGPLTISETLLQRIWHEGDFAASGLRLADGRELEVVEPGGWNHGPGPDFKDARLRIDGKPVRGDVEIHFHARDWFYHGHDQDAGYRGVVLHVILFPLAAGERMARTDRDQVPAVLEWLPYLEGGLEEYALLAEREQQTEEAAPVGFREAFAALGSREQLAVLHEKALLRWEQKRRTAARRQRQHGAEEALHQALLETLGYARNRAPMARLALRYPWVEWRQAAPAVDELWTAGEGQWHLGGNRPANHPRRRLEQYAAIMHDAPDWPQSLARGWAWATATAGWDTPTRTARRLLGIARGRRWLQQEVFGGHLGGTRLDTFVVDALLPLMAGEDRWPAAALWFHWPEGDLPTAPDRLLREMEPFATRRRVRTTGWAQGALQLSLDQSFTV